MHLKYDKLERDIFGRPELPVMTLQTMARRTIGTIANATLPELSIKFSEPSEISFDVAAYSDGVPTPRYDDITGHKILYTEECGIYMLMEPEVRGDGVEEVKHVKGYSIEKELEHKSFYLAEGVYNFYNPASPDDTIVGRIIEKADGWHVRYVSNSLYGKYSTMDEYDDYLLSFIYNTAPEKYRCVFVFDPYDMAIDIYDTDEERRTLGIYLDYDNLVTSLGVKELSDELVTAIRAYGADGLSTLRINPTGTEWQYNLDYFIENGDIPADTATRWKAWQSSVFAKQEQYRGLISLKASESARLALLQAELTDLQKEMDSIIERQSVTIQQNALEITDKGKETGQQTLDGINAEKASKQKEINAKQAQVNSSQESVNTYDKQLESINNDLAFNTTKLLTADDRKILPKFFIEKDITQEGFVATDVDVNVSGELKRHGNLTFTVSGSDIGKVGIDINNKTIYSMHGGSFSLGSILSGNIIRATLDIGADKSYIMSVYGGDVVYDGSKHESCVLTISNASLSNLSGNVAKSTEARDGVETTIWRGTQLSFSTGKDAVTYFTTSVTEYQKLSVEMELFDYAADVLKDLSTPTYEFSVDTGNFLFAKEFEPFRDQLELGCAIHLRVSDDRVVTPILIGLDIDFGNLDKLALTFSNRFKLHDSVNTLKEMLETGYSAGRSLDASKYVYGRTVAQATQVSKFMNDSLDVAKNAIVNAQNQSVRIDSAGIHVGGKDGRQLRMINNMIAMTDDNWQHAKLAIGLFGADGARDSEGNTTNQYWGVNADVIGGKLIVGHNLIIENVNDMGVMQFKVDATGAFLNNGVLCIQTDAKAPVGWSTENAGPWTGGRLMIDPRYGIAAGTQAIYTLPENGTTLTPSFINTDGSIETDDYGMPTDVSFFLDIRTGKAYFRGDIHAENGYFRGTVYATDGEFKGIVKATDFQTKDGTSMLTKDGKFDSQWLDLMGINIKNDTGQTVMTIDQTGVKFGTGFSPVTYQYSVDGTSWHDTMSANDKYRRESYDGGGEKGTWSPGYQFKGTDGKNGSDAKVPAYIQSTYIDATKVESFQIRGNKIEVVCPPGSGDDIGFMLTGQFPRNPSLNYLQIYAFSSGDAPTTVFTSKNKCYASWDFESTKFTRSVDFTGPVTFSGGVSGVHATFA